MRVRPQYLNAVGIQYQDGPDPTRMDDESNDDYVSRRLNDLGYSRPQGADYQIVADRILAWGYNIEKGPHLPGCRCTQPECVVNLVMND